MLTQILVALFLIAAATFLFWLFASGKKKKKGVEVYRILGITPGGFHAWCLSNVGRIRKPTNAPELAHLLNLQ